MYLQQTDGSFLNVKVPSFEEDKNYEDLGIQIFDADNDGDNDIYIVSGGNEFQKGSKAYQDRFYENKGNETL